MSKQVATLLDQACARNVAVELHYQSRAETADQAAPSMVTVQSRMLMMDARGLYLDVPRSNDDCVHLGVGDSVDAYFSIRGEMYGFRTTVVSLYRPVKVNRGQSVPSICLAIPKEVSEGQRRGDYRIMLVRDEPISVRLCETGEAPYDRCRVDAERFDGQIINLSRGGFSLRIEAAHEHKLHEQATYFAQFQIPDSEEEHCLMVRARHIRPILQGEALRVGMQFLSWPEPAEFRRQLNRIGAFLGEVERKQCRSAASNERVAVARP